MTVLYHEIEKLNIIFSCDIYEAKKNVQNFPSTRHRKCSVIPIIKTIIVETGIVEIAIKETVIIETVIIETVIVEIMNTKTVIVQTVIVEYKVII